MQQITVAKKLERPVLSRLVQEHIRGYIVTHKLHPGDALPPEGQIAKDLGVSRSSVREAVRALESLGVLEVRHGNGLFVRGVNLDAVLEVLSYSAMFDPPVLLDLLRVRRLVEVSMLEEVVHKIQPEELEECRQNLAEWEANLDAGLPYSKQDQLFHQILYQAVGNQLLVDLGKVFWAAYRNAEAKTIPSAREPQRMLEYHREILRAVESRDVDLAKSLMADHFGEIEGRLGTWLKNAQDVCDVE